MSEFEWIVVCSCVPKLEKISPARRLPLNILRKYCKMWSVNKLVVKHGATCSTSRKVYVRSNQTLVEKIVQKYASDLPSKDYKVR